MPSLKSMKKRRLEWSAEAKSEFAEAMNFYAERNPAAAKRMQGEIDKAAESLIALPISHPGRSGFMAGTRELVVGHRTPFTLIYREKSRLVEILHLWHQSQDIPD